jgi:hypothetical protein
MISSALAARSSAPIRPRAPGGHLPGSERVEGDASHVQPAEVTVRDDADEPPIIADHRRHAQALAGHLLDGLAQRDGVGHEPAWRRPVCMRSPT